MIFGKKKLVSTGTLKIKCSVDEAYVTLPYVCNIMCSPINFIHIILTQYLLCSTFVTAH